METMTIAPDAATREAFIEAVQACVADIYVRIKGFEPDAHEIDVIKDVIPGSVRAYFANPHITHPHHAPYEMFCKGMQYQRVRKPLNA